MSIESGSKFSAFRMAVTLVALRIVVHVESYVVALRVQWLVICRASVCCAL